MKEEQIIEWVGKYSKGQMTEEDIKLFENWLNEEPANPLQFAKYRKMYRSARELDFLINSREENAWIRIVSQIKKSPQLYVQRWMSIAAAAVIIVLVSSWFIWSELQKTNLPSKFSPVQLAENSSEKILLTLSDGSTRVLDDSNVSKFNEKDGTSIVKDSTNNLSYHTKKRAIGNEIYNRITVPRGGDYSLVLADGTKVWLNADSEFKYPVNFTAKQRQVFLSGEAYFEVAHDKNAPFIVKTQSTQIRVLGTHFNVSAYKEQAFTTTTLVEGKVKVKSNNASHVLNPGFQSVIDNVHGNIVVDKVDPLLYTSWIHGVFEFENMDLDYITVQLSRWYDVNFQFDNQELMNIKFTGAIKRDKSVDYALGLIGTITNVSFIKKGNTIIVKK